MARAGVTQEELRRHNLSAVLSRVHVDGPTTRAELTASLGLNRSTIGTLTADLVAAGLVREELPDARARAGRPSLVVVPESERVAVLAVDLGVEHLGVARVGLGGVVLDRRERRHERGGHHVRDVVDAVSLLCHDLLAAAPPGALCLGVGAAVPGVVREDDGLVRFAPNLGWVDEPFGALLTAALGLPVRTANDADLGALAEHRRGAARGVADVVYLAGEVGVGGGVLVGGRTLRGVGGYAGEVGHLVLRPGGRHCRCGARGCWETEIGENAILVPAGRLPGGGRGAVREVIASADGGEQRAAEVVADVSRWLGRGLGALVNIFNPAVVVLGGVLADVFGARRSEVLDALRESSLPAPGEQVRICVPELGRDSSLLGAAELAFADLLADPLTVVGAVAAPA